MNQRTKQILFWIPRVIGILFALFISIFAFDVFSEGYSFGETILALLMHLVPTFIFIILLTVAWRQEGFGAMLIIALALFLLISSQGESLILSIPLLVLGALFLFNWFYRKQLSMR